MLILLLGLFFHYHLLHCVKFETDYSNGPLRTWHKAARNHDIMNCSIRDIMWNSTPGIEQINRISPHYSFLPTPISHETYIPSPTEPTPQEPFFTERFPQSNKRNQKITQRKISNRQLKNIAFRHQPRHQLRQGITVLEITKRRNLGPKAKVSPYDSVRWSREPALHRIKRSHALSTGIKKRLFPNLLLSDGIAAIGDDINTDNDDELERMIPQMDEGEGIMRMHAIPETTETSTETTTARELLRYETVTKENPTKPPAITTSHHHHHLPVTTVAHPYFEMIEALQEGYMMVFLIELTRLIATKEGKAVRDVVKHADQIIYGFYQSGQLQWFGKPLIDVTTKLARWLKSADIDVIQNYAANLHDMLSQRHEELPAEVNTILEYADMLYDDYEGRFLFDALKDFSEYPNITLNAYWLCNRLINNFLRPYRRLKDTQQRQELMDYVNLQLKSYKKTQLRNGVVSQDNVAHETKHSPQTQQVTQTVPHTTQPPREKKRKRHHRSHKRKREKKRHRIHRYRSENSLKYHQNHVFRSITQRTGVQSWFRLKKQKPKIRSSRTF